MSDSNAQQFAIEAARIASDDKCTNVVILDLRGLSGVADYYVIATGTSDRQMLAVGDHIQEYGRKVGERIYGKRLDSEVWVLLDFVDVVIHVFDAERRDYYDLELMWGDAPKVEWMRSATA